MIIGSFAIDIVPQHKEANFNIIGYIMHGTVNYAEYVIL